MPPPRTCLHLNGYFSAHHLHYTYVYSNTAVTNRALTRQLAIRQSSLMLCDRR